MKSSKSSSVAWLAQFAVKVIICVIMAGFSATSSFAALFPIASGGAAQSYSFDGTNYLVGIENHLTISQASPTPSIAAQLITAAGAKSGPLITTGRTGIATNVAFDGTNYLLIWEDDGLNTFNGNTGWQIYGQFISTAGATVGSPFAISSMGVWFDGVKTMAFGGGKYLVTYTKLINPALGDQQSNRYIAGKIVDPGGSVGSEFQISSGNGAGSDIAFDGANFFVVWREDFSDQEIRGRFVSPAGVLGTEVSVNASTAPSDNPISVAFDGTNYLVVWNDETGGAGTGTWDVFGQRINTSGSLVGGVITITNEPGTQMVTSVAFDGVNYLAVWMDMQNQTNWDMYGRYINKSGALIGSKVIISTDATNQMGGVGFANGKYLVLVNSGVTMGQGGITAVASANGLFLTPIIPTSTLYTANGTYTYVGDATGGTLTMNVTSSSFFCNGPSVGTDTKTVTSLGATSFSWTNQGGVTTWSRTNGTAGIIAGTWSTTDPGSGDTWTLVFSDDGNGNRTVSATGNVHQCWVSTPPAISSFSPASGMAGNLVTINGSNFSPIPSNNIVLFNGVQALVTGARSSQIFAVVPEGAGVGTISVSNSGGTATSVSNFSVTAGVAPATLAWGGVHHRNGFNSSGNALEYDALDVGINSYATSLAGMTLTVTDPTGSIATYPLTDANLSPYINGQLALYKTFTTPASALPAGVYTFTLNDGQGHISHRVDTHVTVTGPVPKVDSSTIQIQRKSDGSYRISWAPLNDTKTYFYRIHILRNNSTSTPVYASSRSMSSFADVPAGVLFDDSMYKLRVEAGDSSNNDLATNRSDSSTKLFSPLPADYNANRLITNFAAVYNRTDGAASQTFDAALNVNDHSKVTSITLTGPAGFVTYNFNLATDISNRTNDGTTIIRDFTKNFPNGTVMPTGLYTFTYVANGVTHKAYAALTAPLTYPVVDSTTMQAQDLGNSNSNSNGNTRFSWASVNHSGVLYYRAVLNKSSTALSFLSPLQNQAFVDVPNNLIAALSPDRWRVEVYDSNEINSQRNRFNTAYKALTLPLPAFDATAPALNNFFVRNLNNPGGGSSTQLLMNAADSDGAITLRQVDGPNGYTRNLTTPDSYSLASGGYSLTETGSPASGRYSFTAVDNSGKAAVRYKYQSAPKVIPAVDFHTFQVNTEPNGDTRISWAPVVSDIPIWYKLELWNAANLSSVIIPSGYTAGNIIQQSSVSVPSTYMQGQLMFRIQALDDGNNTTFNNISKSVMVKLQTGFNYATLTDSDNDGYTANIDTVDNNANVTPFKPTASGTYTYTPGNSGPIQFNWASSSFICDGPDMGAKTENVTSLTATAMTWSYPDSGSMVWTRSNGTAGDILGAWSSTDTSTGSVYAITFNANNTVSVTASIVQCSSGGGGPAEPLPPIAQFVNSSGSPLNQISIGNIQFDGSAICSSGCSTSFLTVPTGTNQISLKETANASPVSLGSLGSFVTGNNYAVNIRNVGGYCAELWQMSDPSTPFNNNLTKYRISTTCANPGSNTITLKSDASTLAASIGSAGGPDNATLARLDTADTTGLTFQPTAVGAFGTYNPIPANSPPGTVVINIPPGDGRNGYFKTTFTLPVGFTNAMLDGKANIDDKGRAFLNGNAISPSLSSNNPMPISEGGDVSFTTGNQAFFNPGINELLFSDANTGAGPSGAAFYAVITYNGGAAAQPPTITNFTPTSGAPGTQIVINGTNFDPNPGNNTVKFNGVNAQVLSASSTQIIVTAPATGTTGPISVTISGLTATGGTFTYGVPSPSYTLEALTPTVTAIKGDKAEFLFKAVFNAGFNPVNGITFSLTGNNVLAVAGHFTPVPLKGSGGVAFRVNTAGLPAGSYQGTVTASDGNLQIISVPVTLVVSTVSDIKFFRQDQILGKVYINSLNVTTQGELGLIGSEAYDAGNNLIPQAPITMTSGNPAILGVYGIYFSGNSFYSLDNGSTNLTATTPDGFSKNLPVSISVPNSPKVDSFIINPSLISNKDTGPTKPITISGSVTRPPGSGVGWGAEGDMTGFVEYGNPDIWDANYIYYNNSIYLDPAVVQEPRTVGLYISTTTGFGSFDNTAKREVPLTVFNDPAFSAGRFYIKSLDSAMAGPHMGGGTFDFCDMNGTVLFSRMSFEHGIYGWIEKGAIEPGTYKIRYTPMSGASQWYPNATSQNAALPVTFTAGATADEIYFFTASAPNITSFTLSQVPNTLSVNVSLAATSSIRISDYCLTEASTPANCTWLPNMPSGYTFATFGAKTLYAFVRDSAGSVSSRDAAITLTAPVTDTTPPVINIFTIPSPSDSPTVTVNLSATDNFAVTGYCLTEVNSAANCSWSPTVPTYTFASPGVKALYAFARDEAGNISAASENLANVTINNPAATGLTLTSANFLGGPGDQRGTALTIANGSLFVTGQTGADAAVVAKYALPLLPGSATAWSRGWGFGVLNGLSLINNKVVGGGYSMALTTDGVGGTEIKSILAGFNTDNSNGGLSGGASLIGTSNFFSYTGVEFMTGLTTAIENAAPVIYAAAVAQPCSYDAYVIAKYDANGQILKRATDSTAGINFNQCYLPSLGSSYAGGLTVLNGSIYVAGHTAWPNFGDTGGRPAIWKYDQNLALQWQRKDATLNGVYNGVASLGNYLYAVGSTPVAGKNDDYLVEKYDESGNMIWRAVSGGTGSDVLRGITAVGNRLFAVGYSSSAGSGGNDAVILEIDPQTGATISSTYYGGPLDDMANAVATDGTDLYVVGEARSFSNNSGNSAGQNEIVILRYTLTAPVNYVLTVSLAGNGSGSVSSDPPGITCPAGGCSSSFPDASQVVLTATPSANSALTGWSGCNSINANNTCNVTMNSAKPVTATFTMNAAPAISSFSPANGAVGSQITISGVNFDPVKGNNTVKFSNNLTAQIISATATQLVVTVPAGAVTGPITVATATGGTSPNSAAFTVITQITYYGNVVDSVSAVIAGATIEMVGNPGITTTSDANGNFALTGLPIGTPYSFKISKATYSPTFSNQITMTSDITARASYVLFKPENLLAWGVTPGKGVISNRLPDNLPNSSDYLYGGVITATSAMHPAAPYQVLYSDGQGLGGSSTMAVGQYVIRNIDDGDTVTVSASKAGWNFPTRTFIVHADGVSQARLYGNSVAPGNFAIATTAGQEMAAGAAFDGINYLVGIQGDALAANNVTAQLVSTAGALVGNRISIGRTGGAPQVAFDGSNFLMVWEDDATNPYDNIYGQLIGRDGTKIGAPFAISQTFSRKKLGIRNLLFDGRNYFVAWENRTIPDSGDTADIYGQFVTPAGSLLGAAIPVSTATHGQRDAAVSFDGTNILAAWADGRSQSACTSAQCYESDIYGQFVAQSTNQSAGALTGINFAISTSSLPRDNPIGLAYDGTNYLVTFHEQTTLPDACPSGICEWNVYAQRVSKGGAAVGARITISNASGNQHFPIPYFNGSQYLITWTHGLGTSGSRVSTKGVFLNPANGTFSSPEFTLFADTTDGRVPWAAVPAGFIKGKYLVLANWGKPGNDPKNFDAYSNADVYGALIGNSSLATGASSSISPAPLAFGTVDVGNSATQTVTVTNNGPGSMTVFSNYFSGDTSQFTFSAAPGTPCPSIPFTMAPGSCTFAVTFTPTSVGPKTAYLTYNTDTANAPVYVLTLGGTGFIPAGDNTPPQVTALTLPQSSKTFTVAVTNFTASDDTGVTGFCLKENISPAGCVWLATAPVSYTFSGTDGLKTLYGFARDATGNISMPLVRQVLIDTAAPVIPLDPVVRFITDKSAQISWQTNELTQGKVVYGTSNPPSVDQNEAAPALNHAVNLTGLTGNTTYYLKVTASDALGNGPSSSGLVTFTTQPAPDLTPPVITAGPSVVSIGPNTATIVWKTDVPTSGTGAYGLTNTPATPFADPPLSVNHAVALNGLVPLTTYYVRVSAVDANGNGPTSSPVISFTTPSVPDTIPPVIIQGPQALGVTDSSATIVWATDETSDGSVSFSDGTTTSVVTDPAFTTTHKVVLTGLKQATQYTYTVSSSDRVPNGPATSAAKSFTTGTTPDVTPPSFISGPNAVFIDTQRAFIAWDTDEQSDSLVEYGLNSNSLDRAAASADLVKRHGLQLGNLTQGTPYFYRVRSRDVAGNEAVSSPLKSFTTKAVQPVVPLALTQLPAIDFNTGTMARVTWKTNKPADTRVIYGDTSGTNLVELSLMDKTTDHVMILPNLLPGTPYTVLYSSTDMDNLTVAGYVGGGGGAATAKVVFSKATLARPAYSNTGTTSFTTPATPDTTPPVITAGPSVTSTGDTTATIQWTTNEIADSLVACTQDGQSSPLTFGDIAQSISHSIVLTRLTPNSTYTCQVASTDPLGNGPTTSNSFSLTTAAVADTTPPALTAAPALTLKGNGLAALAWKTDKAAVSLVRYGAPAALNDLLTTNGAATDHSLTIANLTPGQLYNYTVELTDPSNNKSTTDPLVLSLKFGDCDNTGSVNIAEVQTAINMLLGLKPPQVCVDFDASGSVGVSKVQKAINSFLGQ